METNFIAYSPAEIFSHAQFNAENLIIFGNYFTNKFSKIKHYYILNAKSRIFCYS